MQSVEKQLTFRISQVKKQRENSIYLPLAFTLIGLFFNPEDGSDMFYRDIA
jgi:hypothetical protein